MVLAWSRLGAAATILLNIDGPGRNDGRDGVFIDHLGNGVLEQHHVLVEGLDLALELGADAVTIGGDLYEHERATQDTGNFLRLQFERLAPARAFIAPDAATSRNAPPCLPLL